MNGHHLLDETPEDFEEFEKPEEEQPRKFLNEIVEEEEQPAFKFNVVETHQEKDAILLEGHEPMKSTPEFDQNNE
jgi:hypothetical protein